ncbi:ribonuclease R [Carboxylicivirga mesophila]|uniref:Ribonuclease R n=1 Tax=Carboxylicivirga mesophila TaxID=1166478 RepID=A0ABS5K5V4_9BACT|nr:ribonuclease R [Carboxylicivirga mesophila]MBS2210358.1 ribonuclease R [Carboxylicivirga mesophila]
MGKKKKKSSRKTELRQLIQGLFFNNPKRTFNYKQVSGLLEVKKKTGRQQVQIILNELFESGYLTEVAAGKYKLLSRGSTLTGVVDMTATGSAYVVPDEENEGGDIFIPRNNMNQALHGDHVKVFMHARRRNRQPEGEIIEVLKRKRETFVGVMQISRGLAFLVVDDRVMPHDIFIPPKALNGAKDGQKAIARIVEWPERAKNPIGEIIDVLGDVGDNQAEMHAILAEFNLPYRYPQEVIDEAETIDAEISPEEIKKRRDFRQVTTFTIDPVDAKDFDDALSLQKLDNGNWEVGVHIADVTHYVEPKSLLEKEAYDRATSVYLVDRVVPMLPERLSNFICSLRPHEEKLCFSAVFEMDDQANVINSWFGRTVIYSDRRFTYEEAQEIIETGKGDLSDEILTLDKLAKALRDKRFSEGSVGFERVEVKFNIDEKGKPVSVFFKESKDANKLIEEFMLLANKKVAQLIGNKELDKGSRGKPKTFVYRIHDVPNPDKFENFASFVRRFGYEAMPKGVETVSASLNRLLEEVKGKGEQNMIETLAIRTMAKAVYSTHNIGHYGLSFKFYSHFTSPIRRYPDMMVHRLLQRYLDGGRSVNEETYEEMCEHSSDMEQRAADAERASIKYKQVEFMKDHIGQTFEGVISGVTEWGLYVEIIENKCEGMIPIRDLDDDFYHFDEDNYCLVGRKYNRKYQLGDQLKIVIANANLEKKQLDFALADGETDSTK